MAKIDQHTLIALVTAQLHNAHTPYPISQGLVRTVLEALLEQIQAEVEGGNRVQLLGFGTFERRQRQARTGTDPRSGESITIPASESVGFTAGETFRTRISGRKRKRRANTTE
jgi:nucleoid DNA-binding protein